jgi:hypothetical protein
LTLALRADLRGPRERALEGRFDGHVACDLAADVADQPAQPGAQEAHLPMVAVELLGVGIASRHHRRLPGDADVGLPQLHAVAAGQAIEALDRRMQELGVGREGDVLGLYRGVDGDPRQVPGAQRAAVVCHPQALGQQQLELVAQARAPMAEVGTFVRERVLEERLAGEVLEVRIVDPALTHAFV